MLQSGGTEPIRMYTQKLKVLYSSDDWQPKIKEIQIQLTGFLNKDTPAFCKELWDLMLSAQDSPMGVPKETLEAKKLELQQEQVSCTTPLVDKIANVNAAIESSRRVPP